MEESHRIWTERNWRDVADIESLTACPTVYF